MTQKERTARTREKILRAAIAEFGTYGYAGGTIGGICSRGINRGLVYHNFKDKDTLYLACMEESCGELVRRLEALPIGEQEETEALIKNVLEVRAEFAEQCALESRILFEGLLMPPANLRAEIRGILKPLDSKNKEFLRSAINHVRLRQDVRENEAMRVFSLIQYAYNGYFQSESMKSRTLEERMQLHEKEIPRILDCLLYGIAEKKDGKKEPNGTEGE